VGEGGVAILYFSYRLILFPIGIFSNALSQAILPVFSVQALEETRDELKQTLSFGLRATFFVMLPASIGYIVLARPIIKALFEGGRFGADSAIATAQALLFYSIGLFAYGGTRILQSCFFALKDTKTPAKVAAMALVVNIILNCLLMFPLKIAGLALATSISGISTFLVLFAMLKKRLGDFGIKDIIVSFLRILLASICMGLVCYFAGKINIAVGNSLLQRAVNLALPILAGLLSFVLLCFIFRVSEMRELWRWVAQRRNK
jgi:putative peptidoglycan lipid II flippase